MGESDHNLMSWLKQVVSLEEFGPGPVAEPPATTAELPSAVHDFGFDWRWAVAALGVVVVGWLLAAVFAAQLQIGTRHLPAHASDKVLSSAITAQASTYRLAVKYPDGKVKQFPLQTVGYTLDSQATLKQTRADNYFVRRLAWWHPWPVKLVLKKNITAFTSFLSNQINLTVQPSQDATLSFTNGRINLTNAVTGKQYGLSHPDAILSQTASSFSTQPVKLQTLTINPALTAATLAPYKATLEKTVNQPLSLTIGSRTVTPSPSDIATWLEITPDGKTQKVDISVNSGKIQAYINSVAAASIQPPRAEVDVVDPNGGRRVLVPGSNGVDVAGKNDVATNLANNLLKGQGFSAQLTINQQPFQTITAGDYAKWIEVDLTNKRLYAYEHANLVKLELVSAGAPATPTVTGQYNIYAKYDQQDMRGLNVDGSKYFQPHVRWINYFYRDYAIHGNYWRPLSYFGNINSSHGCVSMPDSEAVWIYNWAPIGTPVIVHT